MSIPPLLAGDVTIINDCAKADLLNQYFYSVLNDENCSDLNSLKSFSDLSPINQSITFTTNDVF